MRNILFLVLFVAALLLSFYYFREHNKTKIRLQETETKLTETENKLTQCKILADSLQEHFGISKGTEYNVGQSEQTALEKLKAAGFTEPEMQLLQSLQSQSSLLPQKPVLGGTMAYRDLTILTKQFALGYYEDGHNGGYALLEYSAKNPQQIRWTLIGHHEL